MRNSTILFIGVLVLIIVGGVAFWAEHMRPAPASTTTTSAPVATVAFACNAGKSITASFYNGAAAAQPAPGQPPTPTGHVQLTLSDGRSMTLPQTVSADGARYSDGNPQVAQGQPGAETFVFWEKGNGAMVLENNQQQTYTGCVAVAPNPGSLPQVYSNGTEGFSLRYPAGYTPDASYQYQELGPGKSIGGVKFTIATSTSAGTNLSSDSYVSVEEIPQAANCQANLFLDASAAPAESVTDGGTTYSVASSTGAGAGNRYEETVYALPGTNPCVAVRYYIHYGVLENYPTGAVVAFDEAALLKQFDAVRRTLTLAQ